MRRPPCRGAGGPPAERPARHRAGSVLLEAVLCLPLLLMLVTGIVQFSRIWEARLFTQYAAWNAARATLVYNPREYAEIDGATGRVVAFRERRGPAWQAAANTLAWVAGSGDGPDANLWFPGGVGPGETRVPNSAGVWNRVRVNPTASWESNGLVRVSVSFRMPLVFRVFDPTWLFPSARDAEGTSDPLASLDPDLGGYPIEEACVLPKPWSTALYPLLSWDEKMALADQRSGFVVPDPSPSLSQAEERP